MQIVLANLYTLCLYGAFAAGMLYLRTAPAQNGRAFQVPWATLLLALLIAIPTTYQFFYPEYLILLRRDTTRFTAGEWWRLFTPLFVQDGGVAGAVFNLVSLLLIGTVAERLWGGTRVVLFFFVGGFVGEIVGMAWQPVGAGNSVGNFSLWQGVLPWPVWSAARQSQRRFAAIVALAAGVALVALRRPARSGGVGGSRFGSVGRAAVAPAGDGVARAWILGRTEIVGPNVQAKAPNVVCRTVKLC